MVDQCGRGGLHRRDAGRRAGLEVPRGRLGHVPAGPGAACSFSTRCKIHYRKIGRELATDEPLDAEHLAPPVVLLPMRGWSAITRKALRFALKISHEIYALHIAGDEQTMVALEDGWNRLVREPTTEGEFARAQADHHLFPVSPALSAADRGRHRPEESATRTATSP